MKSQLSTRLLNQLTKLKNVYICHSRKYYTDQKYYGDIIRRSHYYDDYNLYIILKCNFSFIINSSLRFV